MIRPVDGTSSPCSVADGRESAEAVGKGEHFADEALGRGGHRDVSLAVQNGDASVQERLGDRFRRVSELARTLAAEHQERRRRRIHSFR